MGRKPKLTKEIINEISILHSKGLPIRHCLAQVNVGKTAFYNWMQKGEEGCEDLNGLYIELYKEIKKARALCIQHYLMKAWENPSPSLIIYMLKVYDPDTFNIVTKTENTNHNVQTINDLFSEEQIKQIAEDKGGEKDV